MVQVSLWRARSRREAGREARAVLEEDRRGLRDWV